MYYQVPCKSTPLTLFKLYLSWARLLVFRFSTKVYPAMMKWILYCELYIPAQTKEILHERILLCLTKLTQFQNQVLLVPLSFWLRWRYQQKQKTGIGFCKVAWYKMHSNIWGFTTFVSLWNWVYSKHVKENCCEWFKRKKKIALNIKKKKNGTGLCKAYWGAKWTVVFIAL